MKPPPSEAAVEAAAAATAPLAWQVAEGAEPSRLDRAVAERLDQPRNQVQGWIRAGLVTVNDAPAKPSTALAPGDRIVASPPLERTDERIVPEPGELVILHQDPHLLVLDKPAGITVHPGAGRPTGTLAHRLLAHFPEIAGVGGPGRPGIVHRLDHDTSGVMVVAKTAEAYRRLAEDFAHRRVEKRYLALAYGNPPTDGTIQAPIGRHSQRRTEMAVRPRGRPALTHYRVLGSASVVAALEVDLKTGRTHQIRVHLKHAGYPLVGDPVYGEARWKRCPAPSQGALRSFPRPALHAWSLRLRHPVSGEELAITAPVPDDLVQLWERLGGEPRALAAAPFTTPLGEPDGSDGPTDLVT